MTATPPSTSTASSRPPSATPPTRARPGNTTFGYQVAWFSGNRYGFDVDHALGFGDQIGLPDLKVISKLEGEFELPTGRLRHRQHHLQPGLLGRLLQRQPGQADLRPPEHPHPGLHPDLGRRLRHRGRDPAARAATPTSTTSNSSSSTPGIPAAPATTAPSCGRSGSATTSWRAWPTASAMRARGGSADPGSGRRGPGQPRPGPERSGLHRLQPPGHRQWLPELQLEL